MSVSRRYLFAAGIVIAGCFSDTGDSAESIGGSADTGSTEETETDEIATETETDVETDAETDAETDTETDTGSDCQEEMALCADDPRPCCSGLWCGQVAWPQSGLCLIGNFVACCPA